MTDYVVLALYVAALFFGIVIGFILGILFAALHSARRHVAAFSEPEFEAAAPPSEFPAPLSPERLGPATVVPGAVVPRLCPGCHHAFQSDSVVTHAILHDGTLQCSKCGGACSLLGDLREGVRKLNIHQALLKSHLEEGHQCHSFGGIHPRQWVQLEQDLHRYVVAAGDPERFTSPPPPIPPKPEGPKP